MPAPDPTPGASLRASIDHLTEEILRQLKTGDCERARELLLRGLKAKREVTVLTHTTHDDAGSTHAAGEEAAEAE